MLLKDKVALVTGANRGIGYAVSAKLASEGCYVYAGTRSVDTFPTEVEGAQCRVAPVELDVTNKDTIRNCILKIKDEKTKVDILVNNAGIIDIGRLEMIREDTIRRIYETNVYGTIITTQMVMKLLKKSTCPNIINISSVLCDNGAIGQTVYAGSKAAVANMTKTWAKEYTPLGFRVNAVAPGNISSDMFNSRIDSKGLKDALDKTGMARLGKPEEVADAVLFLASDMSSYISGEILHVDGGLVS